jgi:hypothetical protein
MGNQRFLHRNEKGNLLSLGKKYVYPFVHALVEYLQIFAINTDAAGTRPSVSSTTYAHRIRLPTSVSIAPRVPFLV